MTQHTRSIVAYLAGALITQTHPRSLFVHSEGEHLNFEGDIDHYNVNLYDPLFNCKIIGQGINGKFNLFHYGDSHHIQLNIEKNHFEGFDYGSQQHFNGEVIGRNIKLFDYGDGNYSDYSI
jgi:hypothetical protein